MGSTRHLRTSYSTFFFFLVYMYPLKDRWLTALFQKKGNTLSLFITKTSNTKKIFGVTILKIQYL